MERKKSHAIRKSGERNQGSSRPEDRMDEDHGQSSQSEQGQSQDELDTQEESEMEQSSQAGERRNGNAGSKV